MGNPVWRHLDTVPMVTKKTPGDRLDTPSGDRLGTITESPDEDIHETLMFYETEIPKRLQHVDQAFMSYSRKNVYICPETLLQLKRRISVRHNFTFQVFALSVVNGRYGIVFEI